MLRVPAGAWKRLPAPSIDENAPGQYSEGFGKRARSCSVCTFQVTPPPPCFREQRAIGRRSKFERAYGVAQPHAVATPAVRHHLSGKRESDGGPSWAGMGIYGSRALSLVGKTSRIE